MAEEDIRAYVDKYRDGYGAGFFDAALIYKEETLKFISSLKDYEYRNMKEDIRNIPIYLWVMNREEEIYPTITQNGAGKNNEMYTFQLQNLSYDMPSLSHEMGSTHYALLQVTNEQGEEIFSEIICLRSGEWKLTVEDLTGDGIDDIYIYTGDIHYPLYQKDDEGQNCYVWDSTIGAYDTVVLPDSGCDYVINKTYHCLLYINSTLSQNILRCNAYEYRNGKFISAKTLEICSYGNSQNASDDRKGLDSEEFFIYIERDEEQQEYADISLLPIEEYDFWFNSELERGAAQDRENQFPLNWLKDRGGIEE